MRAFQRLASAARGTLWLLRATGLRNHFSKLESRLNDLDVKVLHVAYQNATAVGISENVQRVERQISDVMADVAAQQATTMRVAESVQRLGKHIVDVGANNLTTGRLSEQFQKLEKHLHEIGSNHLANGKMAEQFQKLERHLSDLANSGLLNGKLTEQFRKLESAMSDSQERDSLREPLQQLEKQIADLVAAQGELGQRFQKLDKQLEVVASLDQLAGCLQSLGDRLEQASAGLVHIGADTRRQQDQARWLQAQDLRAYERRVHSPGGQDGIIQEILHRIGVEGRYFVELGVKSGTETNCARLVVQENWIGFFVESDHDKLQQLTEQFQSSWGVHCRHATVTSRNIEQLLAENGVPFNLDVLAINVHGNDYWLWNALNRWRPRLIVIEYNSHFPPSKKWVMQENLDHQCDGTSYYGASLASLTTLGRKKGYTLVATDTTGQMAFFVRDDLATAERFLDPVVHYHYSSSSLGPFLGGHPPASGPHVEI